MFTRLAVVINADNGTQMIPVGTYANAQQVKARVERNGTKLLRIMDNRYNASRKKQIMDAWLGGASVAELQAIHES